MNDVPMTERPITPPAFHQLGILVLDGSGSMGPMGGFVEGRITKAEAVNTAVRELLTRLKASSWNTSFSIAVVTFSDTATRHTNVTRVEDEQGNTINDYGNYDPIHRHEGGTKLDVALAEAHRLGQEFLANPPMLGVPHSVVIVVMSDGMSEGNPKEVADDIKKDERIKIAASLFARKNESDSNALIEANAGERILKDIVSSPTLYRTVYDARTLREFFVASVTSGTGANVV